MTFQYIDGKGLRQVDQTGPCSIPMLYAVLWPSNYTEGIFMILNALMIFEPITIHQ